MPWQLERYLLRCTGRAALSGALLLCLPAHSASGPEVSAPAPQASTRQEVQAATQALRADPHMPQVKTEKWLRFKNKTDDKPKPPSDTWQWLKDLVRAVMESARFLLWALGAFAFAWAVVRLRHWIRLRAGAGQRPPEILPSHVGALDIRPQSLPDDVGQAAAALWQSGQPRPALSLLYRGALSRLVHWHAVPIRSASTEGECLALSTSRLAPGSLDFLRRLVQVWQLAAYAERLPAGAVVLGLCAEFAPCLDPVAAAPKVAA